MKSLLRQPWRNGAMWKTLCCIVVSLSLMSVFVIPVLSSVEGFQIRQEANSAQSNECADYMINVPFLPNGNGSDPTPPPKPPKPPKQSEIRVDIRNIPPGDTLYSDVLIIAE